MARYQSFFVLFFLLGIVGVFSYQHESAQPKLDPVSELDSHDMRSLRVRRMNPSQNPGETALRLQREKESSMLKARAASQQLRADEWARHKGETELKNMKMRQQQSTGGLKNYGVTDKASMEKQRLEAERQQSARRAQEASRNLRQQELNKKMG